VALLGRLGRTFENYPDDVPNPKLSKGKAKKGSQVGKAKQREKPCVELNGNCT